jgi:tetratricopeptide (TPR) repeat protein
MRLPLPYVLLAAALVLVPTAAWSDHDDEQPHGVPEKLGRVSFSTTCDPTMQETFDRGVALLHSFAYPEAAQAFGEVAARDPGCAMAQWGVAMSFFHIVWGPPTPDEFAAGRAAAERAAALSPGSDRERDWIAAIGAFYAGEGLSHQARTIAFEQAMAGVAARNPGDSEAQIFHALAILGVAYNSPPDKTYARQKQAAEILNRQLEAQPEHPGIAHYLIHSFDFPETAALALNAAYAYAKIAPSAPHALHMPSHIFTRLGMWRESIQSNLASAASAQAWIAKTHPGAAAYEALHAKDYLEYAYLQIGQDALARKVADDIAATETFNTPTFSAGFALSAIPARYALERHTWKEAAALTVRPATFPWDKYPYAEANVHFARAVGAARTGDVATARQALARLAEIKTSLEGQKGFDWATQVEILRRAAAGWLARAEKKNDEALGLLRSAADLEDSTDKHPVTPGSLLPAREQLADLLLELKRPADALAEYEASLRVAPGRFNSYRGAALAAAKAGDRDKAREMQDRLSALCGGVVPEREAMSSNGGMR